MGSGGLSNFFSIEDRVKKTGVGLKGNSIISIFFDAREIQKKKKKTIDT